MMLTGDRQVSIGEKGPFHALLAEFSQHFERIDVLCPKPPRPVSVKRVFDSVQLHPAPCGRSGMLGWLVATGRRIVNEQRPGLVTSHDYGIFTNGRAAARLGVPYLSELHHVPGYPVAADWRERIEKRLTRRYVAWAKKRAFAFRVVNHVQMPRLLRSWDVPESMVRVIPSLYIDLDVFQPRACELELDVTFVGRLVVNKGLDMLVDALALVARQRGLAPRVLFVGRGPCAKRLRQRIAARGLDASTQFVDWVDGPEDLANIYRKSRLVVCSSTCEGGPRFTVEAMACGTPVVSTPVGVMEDLLGDGGAGRLTGFGAESIAEGICAVLEDEERRLEMGRSAVLLASEHEYRGGVKNYADALKGLAEEARSKVAT